LVRQREIAALAQFHPVNAIYLQLGTIERRLIRFIQRRNGRSFPSADGDEKMRASRINS
jgi:hypothetical protein